MSNRRKGHIYWHDDWKKMKQEVKTEQNKVLWLEMSDPFPLNPYPPQRPFNPPESWEEYEDED